MKGLFDISIEEYLKDMEKADMLSFVKAHLLFIAIYLYVRF